MAADWERSHAGPLLPVSGRRQSAGEAVPHVISGKRTHKYLVPAVLDLVLVRVPVLLLVRVPVLSSAARHL